MNELQPINIETFKSLIGTAPTILEQNRTSIEKASERYNQLQQMVEDYQRNSKGALLSEEQSAIKRNELRPLLNTFLVKLKETYKKLNERRTPLTGLFDDFKKGLIQFEAQVDPKGKDNMYSRFQDVLNSFAAEDAKILREKQAEIQRQNNIAQEKIRVQSEIELQLKKWFFNYLENEQLRLTNLFEGITLEIFDFNSVEVQRFPNFYPLKHFETFKPDIPLRYISVADANSILTNVKAGKFETFSTEFRETMDGLKEIFIDKLPSKKTELEAIASANEQERQRLEKEQQERQTEQQRQIAADKAQKEQQAVIQTQTNAQVLQANLGFDHESQIAELQPAQKIKEGYKITVLNASGWLQLISFYFEKEGMKKSPDDLAKMKFEQMRIFAEKQAMKTGEMITNPAIVYEETLKAVVK